MICLGCELGWIKPWQVCLKPKASSTLNRVGTSTIAVSFRELTGKSTSVGWLVMKLCTFVAMYNVICQTLFCPRKLPNLILELVIIRTNRYLPGLSWRSPATIHNRTRSQKISLLLCRRSAIALLSSNDC